MKASYVGIQNGCAAEYKVLRIRECAVDSVSVTTPEQVDAFWRAHIATAAWYDSEKECLCTIWMNTRGNITGFNLVSLGTLDSCNIHPREVFKPIIVASAASFIIAHNHPSGDWTPSEADIKATRDLIRAGQLLKIEMKDHVIVGTITPERKRGYCSLREMGYFYS